MKCQICKMNEAEQEHHVSYFPDEMKIDVCLECHKRIHKHPVGESRRTNTKILKDGPAGVRFPLSDAKIVSTFLCKQCLEEVMFSQSLINLLLFKKSISEPRMKCPHCGVTSYEFQLANSFVSSDHGGFFIDEAP